MGLTSVAVMRKEAVYTVLLNATLFKGMRCFPAQDPRYIRFSVIEHNVTTHYNLRVRTHSAVLLSFLTSTMARFRCRMRRSPKSSSRRSTRTSPPSRSLPHRGGTYASRGPRLVPCAQAHSRTMNDGGGEQSTACKAADAVLPRIDDIFTTPPDPFTCAAVTIQYTLSRAI